jgi:midasin (ATPase involved in ribosome maturation)
VLCLIERALRQLEVGQLAVCSFGSQVRLLSDFSSGENTNLGFQLLGDLKFDQQRTDLAELLASAGALFKSGRERSSNSLVEQMLVVLGDGRGVLTEGVEKIQRVSKKNCESLYLVWHKI